MKNNLPYKKLSSTEKRNPGKSRKRERRKGSGRIEPKERPSASSIQKDLKNSSCLLRGLCTKPVLPWEPLSHPTGGRRSGKAGGEKTGGFQPRGGSTLRGKKKKNRGRGDCKKKHKNLIEEKEGIDETPGKRGK